MWKFRVVSCKNVSTSQSKGVSDRSLQIYESTLDIFISFLILSLTLYMYIESRLFSAKIKTRWKLYSYTDVELKL